MVTNSHRTRIPLVEDADLGPLEVVAAIRQRRGGELLNLDRMLLNSPAYAVGWNGFLGAVRNSLSLDAKLRELAICAVAVLTRAEYEYSQHAPEFLAVGGSQLQLDGLHNIENTILNKALFSEAERATLVLAREMTVQVQVSESCFQALRLALPNPQQQVELVGVIAAYNMVARFLEALQVQPEGGTIKTED
jgi:alkylhydroperoxidase family enzyme